ncbi:MAG TPA: diacylglycerol kinase family protein [Burkholderiaceae bacterium]|nr:diacylglycerol kinase family protein [Burkholderiaceae bacterium]
MLTFALSDRRSKRAATTGERQRAKYTQDRGAHDVCQMGVVQPPSTAPLFVVLNVRSGHRDGHETRALLGRLLSESGRRHELINVEPGADIGAIARRAAQQALADEGIVVAAGGDGTVNAVAQAAHDTGCRLGVLPQGTFNYFGRTHGIPTDIEEATRALLVAHVRPVQVGLVNDRVFLVNASLGLYPDLLEDREHFKSRFGRTRLVAAVAAFATLLREHRGLRLWIELAGQEREVRASTLFVGNNRLQLDQVGIDQRHGIENGKIAAVMLKPVGTVAMLGLLLRGALGTLGEAEHIESFEFQQMKVRPWLPYGTRRVKVAADGEIMWLRTPLDLRVSPRSLFLMVPPAVPAPAPEGGARVAPTSAS